jgi:CRISPR-associated DxTHG motif protein
MTAEQSSRTGDQLVLVTSVGVGRYEEVTYRLEGFRARKCRILPEALADWLKPDLTLVLLTSEAKKHKNWNELEDALKKDKRSFEPVDILDGKNELELWQIFDELKKRLKKCDRVVLDITHAFRSLPVLTLLALTYLRVATGIVLERILYGAFEARDEAGVTPVFDLTPFVSLLQWSAAVTLFRQTGECGPFADLLEEEQDRRYRSHVESQQNELPKKLKNLASDLERLSTALGYLRTKDIGLKANELVKQLRDSKRDLEDFVRPFELLADDLERELGTLDAGEPLGQLRLARWYYCKGRGVHAAQLARELVVNIVLDKHRRNLYSADDRKTAEEELNRRAASARSEGEDAAPMSDRARPEGPGRETMEVDGKLVDIWNSLTNLRNDIAHCGYREEPLAASDLKKQIKTVLGELEEYLKR